MNFLKRRKILKNSNYLELTPVRLVSEDIDSNNLVTMLVPKFTSNFSKNHIVPRLKKSPFIKLKLDKIGSFAWLAIDGKKNVQLIANSLKEKFPDDNQDLISRLTQFLTFFYEQKLITFKEIS